MALPEHLLALFEQPDLVWLVDRLVKRLEKGEAVGHGRLTLANPTASQRRAIDDLIGRRSTGGKSLSVDPARVCRQLNLTEVELTGIIEELRGPVENLRAARDAEALAWNNLFVGWKERLASDPAMADWLDGLRENGILKRMTNRDIALADSLLEQAREILETGSHDDALLASLAARITGDSHALDRGRPLANLCLRAIHSRCGIDGSASVEGRREAWGTIGVTVDDLSAPVLCLNLPTAPGSELSPWIDWHRERGEPFYLSWRQARLFDPDPIVDAVYVCENPAILSEAANRLGPDSRPLICLNGVPSGSVRVLLRRFVDAGVLLKLRADFDWAGLRILDRLHRPGQSRLWRMTVADYLACHVSQPLVGKPFHPEWGSELADEMTRSGLAAYEEELVDILVEDLRGAGGTQQGLVEE